MDQATEIVTCLGRGNDGGLSGWFFVVVVVANVE